MAEPTSIDSIRYFGDYLILGEIARGGMGVVYMAWQTNLNRWLRGEPITARPVSVMERMAKWMRRNRSQPV